MGGGAGGADYQHGNRSHTDHTSNINHPTPPTFASPSLSTMVGRTAATVFLPKTLALPATTATTAILAFITWRGEGQGGGEGRERSVVTRECSS